MFLPGAAGHQFPPATWLSLEVTHAWWLSFRPVGKLREQGLGPRLHLTGPKLRSQSSHPLYHLCCVLTVDIERPSALWVTLFLGRESGAA